MSGYVAGRLLCMLLADRLGRRRSIVLSGTLAAIVACIYPFMTEPPLIIAVVFILVAMAASFLTSASGPFRNSSRPLSGSVVEALLEP